jgi:hypothetical protein
MRTVHKRHLERFLPAGPVAPLALPCSFRGFGPTMFGRITGPQRA